MVNKRGHGNPCEHTEDKRSELGTLMDNLPMPLIEFTCIWRGSRHIAGTLMDYLWTSSQKAHLVICCWFTCLNASGIHQMSCSPSRVGAIEALLLSFRCVTLPGAVLTPASRPMAAYNLVQETFSKLILTLSQRTHCHFREHMSTVFQMSDHTQLKFCDIGCCS